MNSDPDPWILDPDPEPEGIFWTNAHENHFSIHSCQVQGGKSVRLAIYYDLGTKKGVILAI